MALVSAVSKRLACATALSALCALLPAAQSGQSDAEKGNEVFDEHCSSCHNAYSFDRKVGPGLKLLFAKDKLDSNGKPPTETNVREVIDKGARGMPAFEKGLSAGDKTSLIAYLKTL